MLAMCSLDTAPDWKMAVVADLAAVQDLLEALETAGVAERYVLRLGPRKFGVAWR